MSIIFTCLLLSYTRYRIQDTGYKIQDTRYRIQDTGYKIQDTRYRIQDNNVQDARYNDPSCTSIAADYK